jgi:hypothetical protein
MCGSLHAQLASTILLGAGDPSVEQHTSYIVLFA